MTYKLLIEREESPVTGRRGWAMKIRPVPSMLATGWLWSARTKAEVVAHRRYLIKRYGSAQKVYEALCKVWLKILRPAKR